MIKPPTRTFRALAGLRGLNLHLRSVRIQALVQGASAEMDEAVAAMWAAKLGLTQARVQRQHGAGWAHSYLPTQVDLWTILIHLKVSRGHPRIFVSFGKLSIRCRSCCRSCCRGKPKGSQSRHSILVGVDELSFWLEVSWLLLSVWGR